ncbi:DUF2953 domain-containing protein [Virgibacillus ainsalahensis]
MLWLLLMIIFIILMVIFSRISITFNYTYTPEEHSTVIAISMFGIRLFKKEVNRRNECMDINKGLEEMNVGSFQGRLRDILQKVKESMQVTDNLLKNIRVHQLKWITKGGTGEAGSTGVATGAIWGLKGLLTGFVAEKSMLKCKPDIQVTPLFQHETLMTTFDCMISLRLGKAMYALIKVIRIFSIKNKAYA